LTLTEYTANRIESSTTMHISILSTRIVRDVLFLAVLIHCVSGIYEDAPGIAMDYKVTTNFKY